MPVSVQCPACGRTHQAGENMYGRRAQCPCGGVVEIPMPAQTPGKPGIPVVCPSCRTQHQADYALAGRSVQCRCGAVLTVPGTRSAPPTMPGRGSSMLDELSETEMMSTAYPTYGYPPTGYPPAQSGPPGYAPPAYGYAPQAPTGQVAQPKRSDAEVLSGYLEDESWRRPDSYSKNDDGGLFSFESGLLNSGVIGGLIAMLAGILLFFVPMLFGVWFPYSGILFVLGVIGVIRGLMMGR